jgi:hypothetical protein
MFGHERSERVIGEEEAMSCHTVSKEMLEGLKKLQNSIFGSEKFISEAALQLSAGLAKHHPFIGSLAVPGGATNMNFRLTGMIIEKMMITPVNTTTAYITLTVKDPDSYHKDLFLDKALEFALSKIREEVDTLFTVCGLSD